MLHGSIALIYHGLKLMEAMLREDQSCISPTRNALLVIEHGHP